MAGNVPSWQNLGPSLETHTSQHPTHTHSPLASPPDHHHHHTTPHNTHHSPTPTPTTPTNPTQPNTTHIHPPLASPPDYHHHYPLLTDTDAHHTNEPNPTTTLPNPNQPNSRTRRNPPHLAPSLDTDRIEYRPRGIDRRSGRGLPAGHRAGGK